MKNNMRAARQILLGLFIALASGGIVLGAFSLSFAEGRRASVAPASSTSTIVPSATWMPFTPSSGPTATVPTLTWTLTPPPTPVNCHPPPGWVVYLVQPGDTIELLALRYNISTKQISDGNCLLTPSIPPGSLIYLPALPTATPTATSISIPCTPPLGWVIYIVQHGDTLYHLSQAYGISVAELQRANCMGSNTLIRVGQALRVPPWAPHTPSPTPVLPVTDTPTDTPAWPSDTPVPSDTPTPLPSDTPTPIPTDTPTATDTP